MYRSVAVLFLLIKLSACARILCIFPMPMYSHQSVFEPIWKELSLRGHDVTVITPNPLQGSSLENLRQIDISFTYKLVFDDLKMQHVVNTESNILILMKHALYVMHNMTAEQLRSKQVQELIMNEREQFDLVFAEMHFPAWFGLAKKYNCPIIGITSMKPTGYMKLFMGNVNNPVVTPDVNLPFPGQQTFFQRIISVIFELILTYHSSYLVYPPQQRIIREVLNDASVNIYEISKNISLLFSNTMPGLNHIGPSIPSIIELNGLHIKPPKPLPQDIQHFLDTADNGAIYFSLGSNVKSYLISEERKRIFLNVFKKLSMKIIWKIEGEIENITENIKIVSWAPQQDILRHKNVKLFITQGGLQSIEESIRFNVPIIGIPFFGDQFYNLERVKYLKLGDCLNGNKLSEELLENSIRKSIGNEIFLQNMKELSDLLPGQEKSLKQAIWWIEYVIKHKGAEHLRSPLIDMPLYQYYLLDVAFFLLVVIVALYLALRRIAKYLKCYGSQIVAKMKKE